MKGKKGAKGGDPRGTVPHRITKKLHFKSHVSYCPDASCIISRAKGDEPHFLKKRTISSHFDSRAVVATWADVRFFPFCLTLKFAIG